MSEDTVLTKEIAELFIADEESVDLSEFTAIEDEAAEVLSKRESGHYVGIGLDGLKSLSDAAAESLSKHKGDLSLNGLTSLTDAAAEILSKHEGGLDLYGLTSLSDAAAESLSKKEGPLTLEITSVSDEAILMLGSRVVIEIGAFGRDSSLPATIPDNAKDFALAKILAYDEEQGRSYLGSPREGAPLLGELTLPQAEQLSRYADVDVCLNGWYSVESLDVLRALGKGHFLQINLRFDEVTVEIATVLSDFKAAGLGIESENVGGEAARVLLNYRGRFVGARGAAQDGGDMQSAFRWSESHKIFEQHNSMKHWGEVKGLNAKVELEGQCGVCGTITTDTVSVKDIIEGCAGNDDWVLDGLLNNDEVTYGPDDYYSGSGICRRCRETCNSDDESEEEDDWDDED
jgi:hypothetical protein